MYSISTPLRIQININNLKKQNAKDNELIQTGIVLDEHKYCIYHNCLMTKNGRSLVERCSMSFATKSRRTYGNNRKNLLE